MVSFRSFTRWNCLVRTIKCYSIKIIERCFHLLSSSILTKQEISSLFHRFQTKRTQNRLFFHSSTDKIKITFRLLFFSSSFYLYYLLTSIFLVWHNFHSSGETGCCDRHNLSHTQMKMKIESNWEIEREIITTDYCAMTKRTVVILLDACDNGLSVS